MQKNYLLEITSDLFALSAKVESLSRGEVINAFGDFETVAARLNIATDTMQHTKYALAAYIDEIVLTSNSKLALAWIGKSLQLEFFGEHLAGDNFFQRLSQLRQAGDGMVDLWEVYYLCMQLGFMGKYRVTGHEQLLALQVDLYHQINMVRGKTDQSLLHVSKQLSSVVQKKSTIPWWGYLLGGFATVMFIYLCFSLAINRQADKAVMNANNNKQLLLQKLMINMHG